MGFANRIILLATFDHAVIFQSDCACMCDHRIELPLFFFNITIMHAYLAYLHPLVPLELSGSAGAAVEHEMCSAGIRKDVAKRLSDRR